MTLGPYHWCTPTDLLHLDTLYGQARAFPSLVNMVQAAQLRVLHQENHQHGGLDVERKAMELQAWRTQTNYIGRLDLWYSWLEHGPIKTLAKNKEMLESKLPTTDVLVAQDDIGERAPTTISRKGRDRHRGNTAHKSFQKKNQTSVGQIGPPRPDQAHAQKAGKMEAPRN